MYVMGIISKRLSMTNAMQAAMVRQQCFACENVHMNHGKHK